MAPDQHVAAKVEPRKAGVSQQKLVAQMRTEVIVPDFRLIPFGAERQWDSEAEVGRDQINVGVQV